MKNKTKKNYEQMENDDFNDEINDKEQVLPLVKFSTQSSPTACCAKTIPLLYMTENKEKEVENYRRAVKINGMAITRVVFDVCDKEIVLEAVTHYKRFAFPNNRWRTNEELASQPNKSNPEMFFIPTMIVTTFETELSGETEFN